MAKTVKDGSPAVPSPSSSLIILSPLDKQSPCGYDYRIVMVRRNAKSSFKNATVFPGGNVDQADYPEDGPIDRLKPAMETFKKCALRETFEETGILITDPRVSFASGDRRKWRERVHHSGREFDSLLATYKTKVNLDNLVPYANWITPTALPRRYDTHFFLAVVDSAETLPARHDRSETLEIGHFTPQEGIEAYKRGDIVLFVPQLYMLHDLAARKSYKELLTLMRSRPVLVTQPLMKPKLGCVTLPGDEARGGKKGTFNRVHVSFTDGNFVPAKVVRQGLDGFEDISHEISYARPATARI